MSMHKPSSPPPASGEGFQIEIDPSLIEEALAAVDRAGRLEPVARGAPDASEPAFDDEGDADVGIDLSVEDSAAEAAELTRLRIRLEEQEAERRRLERELTRVAEARDTLDRQLREVRKAHSELSSDFERFRTRSKKDVEEAERRGEERTLRPLIEVYDNVERAWLHAVSDPAQILGGLQIIVEQFKRLLTRLGFERIEAERGMLFDPAQHEAVMHVPNAEVLPGTIVDELHAGFRVRGRLFRPARVTVSAPPPGSRD